ncbi:MAG: hypothetical protein ACM3X9_10880 [Bacillota bacterium]
MFSADDLEKAREIIAQLSKLNLDQDDSSGPNAKSPSRNCKSPKKKEGKNRGKQGNNGNGGNQTSCINLLPSELLVIAGIICDVLQVNSVLVDRNQSVEIVLVGTLKRRTQLDKVMQQIGKMPFDQVVQAIMNSSLGDG